MDYTNRKNHLSETSMLVLVFCGFDEKHYFYLRNAGVVAKPGGASEPQTREVKQSFAGDRDETLEAEAGILTWFV
jgi:hypothetical protein